MGFNKHIVVILEKHSYNPFMKCFQMFLLVYTVEITNFSQNQQMGILFSQKLTKKNSWLVLIIFFRQWQRDRE